jgi:bifunctional non-homologous end joining protein LigD
MHLMQSRFVIHQHKTGRVHFDIRIILHGTMRSWSLLHEPPLRYGEKRLAIERESFTADSINCRNFEEEAFGAGNVKAWDIGNLDIELLSAKQLVAVFNGSRFSGKYEFRRMRWYPGNRWMLTKLRSPVKEPVQS